MLFRKYGLTHENGQSSASNKHDMSMMSSYPETSRSIFNMFQLKNLDVCGIEDEISPLCIDRSQDKYIEYEDNDSIFGYRNLLQTSQQSSFVDAPQDEDLRLLTSNSPLPFNFIGHEKELISPG